MVAGAQREENNVTSKHGAGLLALLASACPAQQMETISYPRAGIRPDEVFTQDTLEQSMHYLFSWQQAAGAYGQLTLHSCWAIDGVRRT